MYIYLTKKRINEKKDLKDIFMAGVDRVLGYNAVNDYLNKNPMPGDLNLISIGKAGSSMAKAALENKNIHISSGIIITKKPSRSRN